MSESYSGDVSDSGASVGGGVEFAAGAPIGPSVGAGGVGPAAPVDEIATVWLKGLTAGLVRPSEAATVAWDVQAEFGQPRIELNGAHEKVGWAREAKGDT